jgi:hypothetical protein
MGCTQAKLSKPHSNQIEAHQTGQSSKVDNVKDK